MLRVRAGLAALFAVVAILAVPVAAQAVPRPEPAGSLEFAFEPDGLGTYGPFKIEFLHSGRCANNPGASTANVWLIQYDCGAEPAGLWYFDAVSQTYPSTYWFEVRNVASNKCLNVANASLANGAHVVQYSCAGDYLNNQWAIIRELGNNSNWLFLKNRYSGLCLNVSGHSYDNGGKLIQYECNEDYLNGRVWVH